MASYPIAAGNAPNPGKSGEILKEKVIKM